jgi:hypothetical protein
MNGLDIVGSKMTSFGMDNLVSNTSTGKILLFLVTSRGYTALYPMSIGDEAARA